MSSINGLDQGNFYLELPEELKEHILSFTRVDLPKFASSVFSKKPIPLDETKISKQKIQCLDKAHELAAKWHNYRCLAVLNKAFREEVKLRREELGTKIVELIDSPQLSEGTNLESLIKTCINHGWYLNALKIYFLYKPEVLKKEGIFRSIVNPCSAALSLTFVSFALSMNKVHGLGLLDPQKLTEAEVFITLPPLYAVCSSLLPIDKINKVLGLILASIGSSEAKQLVNASINKQGGVNQENEEVTLLYLLCKRNVTLEAADDLRKLIKFLKETYGLDINQKNKKGETTPHKIASLSYSTLPVLLKNGTDPNSRDESGQTLLECSVNSAIHRGNQSYPNIQSLLNHGAKISHLLLKYVDPTWASEELRFLYGIKNIFTPYGADPTLWELTDEEGNTYLHRLVYSKREGTTLKKNHLEEYCVWMNKTYPDVFQKQLTTRNKQGQTPLDIAQKVITDKPRDPTAEEIVRLYVSEPSNPLVVESPPRIQSSSSPVVGVSNIPELSNPLVVESPPRIQSSSSPVVGVSNIPELSNPLVVEPSVVPSSENLNFFHVLKEIVSSFLSILVQRFISFFHFFLYSLFRT